MGLFVHILFQLSVELLSGWFKINQVLCRQIILNYVTSQGMASCRVSISNITCANLIVSSSPPMTQSACHLEELLFLCLWPALLGVPLCAPIVPCLSPVDGLYGGVTSVGKLCNALGSQNFCCICQQKPEQAFFAATAFFVFSLCGKVLWLH